MQNYKDFATGLARKAGEIMRANFSLGMKKEWKDDNSPLTATDIAINKLVIDSVTKTFPNHGILGEEGSKNQNREYLWVCDPVDGTIAFSHGYPLFVFSLALVVAGQSILGVIYDPVLDRMVYAEKGKGALLNNNKIQVSKTKNLSKNLLINNETELKLIPATKALIKKRCIVTCFCSVSYGSLLVATGEFIANFYEWDKPWDAAAAKIIVEEAGGKVTDLDGKEQLYNQPINGFIASNGFIHDQLVKICSTKFI